MSELNATCVFLAVILVLAVLSSCSHQAESPLSLDSTPADPADPAASDTLQRGTAGELAADSPTSPNLARDIDEAARDIDEAARDIDEATHGASSLGRPSGGSALSDPQIKRFFAASWVADQDATIAYLETAGNEDLQTQPSTLAVPLSYQGTFNQAGFLAKTTRQRETGMFEIDHASPQSADMIRVLDERQFALNVGPCWIDFTQQSRTPQL